jgi:hypothetical protein
MRSMTHYTAFKQRRGCATKTLKVAHPRARVVPKSSPSRRFLNEIKWTRSQPIRTAGQIPVEFSLLESRDPFPYQAIAVRAQQLRRLGMSAASIGRALGVTDKTVAKSIRWSVSVHTGANRGTVTET